MAADKTAGMRKDERGLWVNRYGEVLYVVTVEGNRFLAWARQEVSAINEVIWEHWTRRQRKPPNASGATVRRADDDEAAEVLRRHTSRQRPPVGAGQQTLASIPPDPRLESLLQGSPGLVGADHPTTSKRAARSVTLRSGTQRFGVLQMIRNAPDGLTDEEQQTLFRPNTQRPRRVELLEAGLIEPRGTRKTHSGQDAIVWVITPEGEAAFAACAASQHRPQ